MLAWWFLVTSVGPRGWHTAAEIKIKWRVIFVNICRRGQSHTSKLILIGSPLMTSPLHTFLLSIAAPSLLNLLCTELIHRFCVNKISPLTWLGLLIKDSYSRDLSRGHIDPFIEVFRACLHELLVERWLPWFGINRRRQHVNNIRTIGAGQSTCWLTVQRPTSLTWIGPALGTITATTTSRQLLKGEYHIGEWLTSWIIQPGTVIKRSSIVWYCAQYPSDRSSKWASPGIHLLSHTHWIWGILVSW